MIGGTYSFPDYIDVVKEVTGDKRYSNNGLSHRPNLYGDDTIVKGINRTRFRLEARLVPGSGKRAIGYLIKNITKHNIILGELAIAAGMTIPLYKSDLSRLEISEAIKITLINAKVISIDGSDKYIIRADPGNKIPEIITR